jgi:uncharacterized surface protein with fasciclin (FAS1) repeats
MNRIKKLIVGAMVAALAVTAAVPAVATASGGGSQSIPFKLLALNEKTGKFDTLITGATCVEFRSDPSDPLSSSVIGILAGLDHGTLFAPTDYAFKKTLGLTPANICSAVDPDTVLFPTLAQHVTNDRVPFWELARKARRGGTIDTLGADVDVNGKWWSPRLGDANARIIGQRRASNGQIKIINRVIITPSAP